MNRPLRNQTQIMTLCMRTQNPDSGIEPPQSGLPPQESSGEDGVALCLVQTRAALEQAIPALQRDDGPTVRRYGKRGSTTRFFLK